MVRTPHDIFSFMQSNKIGEKSALFWVAWAFVAEKAQNYKLTDQIFQKGIRKLAEPKDMLQKRYQQFQRRLARIYLNNADILPSEQLSSESSRKALGSLSRQQVQSGHRGGSNASPAILPMPSNQPRPSASSRNNDIHTDAIFQPTGLSENAHWRSFEPMATQSKENAGVPTTWSEAPLKTSAKDKRPVQPVYNIPQDVFIEESFREKENGPQAEKTAKTQKPGTALWLRLIIQLTHISLGLSVRMQFDKSSAKEVVDPLAKHKEEALQDTNEIAGSKIAIIAPVSLPPHTALDGAVKIASRLRERASNMADINSDIYVDSAFKGSASQGVDMDVYIDPMFAKKPPITQADIPKVKGQIHQSSRTSAELQYAPKPALNSRGTGVHLNGSFLTPLDVKVSSDNSNPRLLPISKAANKTVEAIELNDILEDLHVSDVDNSTIHTRVARRDIDLMFCSPDNTYSPDRSLRVLETTKFRTASFGELSDIPEVVN